MTKLEQLAREAVSLWCALNDEEMPSVDDSHFRAAMSSLAEFLDYLADDETRKARGAPELMIDRQYPLAATLEHIARDQRLRSMPADELARELKADPHCPADMPVESIERLIRDARATRASHPCAACGQEYEHRERDYPPGTPVWIPLDDLLPSPRDSEAPPIVHDPLDRVGLFVDVSEEETKP